MCIFIVENEFLNLELLLIEIWMPSFKQVATF